MDVSNTDSGERLVKMALDSGAYAAKIIDASCVVLDHRIRMKCQIPLCSGYNSNLTCPPFAMEVDEFAKSLEMYRSAIILQVEADVNSLPKSDKKIGEEDYEEIYHAYCKHDKFKETLHNIVTLVESEAFKSGYYLATGLVGGRCRLCSVCVIQEGKKVCRHPFSARPPIEALGIDVKRTCENVGLELNLSSSENVKWTGIVLLE
jgi:predicted metal-binding protein|tara:strand:+ start:39 stop:653 length:615 start_codon:yes stop_codon:yes gene_type:complete